MPTEFCLKRCIFAGPTPNGRGWRAMAMRAGTVRDDGVRVPVTIRVHGLAARSSTAALQGLPQREVRFTPRPAGAIRVSTRIVGKAMQGAVRNKER